MAPSGLGQQERAVPRLGPGIAVFGYTVEPLRFVSETFGRGRYSRSVAPKTPRKLRKQVEAQQGKAAAPGHERSAEGVEIRTPTRGEVFGILRKVGKTKR